METALRHEINTKITQLKHKIYPTNAPKDVTSPYLVYARISTSPVKTLDGFADRQSLSFMFSIMATTYSSMAGLRQSVVDLLKGMARTNIGPTDKKIYIEDVNINNICEQYEYELDINRGIIDFTVFY